MNEIPCIQTNKEQLNSYIETKPNTHIKVTNHFINAPMHITKISHYTKTTKHKSTRHTQRHNIKKQTWRKKSTHLTSTRGLKVKETEWGIRVIVILVHHDPYGIFVQVLRDCWSSCLLQSDTGMVTLVVYDKRGWWWRRRWVVVVLDMMEDEKRCDLRGADAK